MATFERLAGMEDVILVRPVWHEDARGFFTETYRESEFAAHGIDCRFVQDNFSLSRQKGTLRGMHFQTAPHAQAKLVRCTRGRIVDAVVDIRPRSATFGRHALVELSSDGGEQLFVPAGFAHGFCTLEDNTEVAYRVSAYYAPDADCGVAFDDPAIGISWPFPASELILSDRDRRWPLLADLALEAGAPRPAAVE